MTTTTTTPRPGLIPQIRQDGDRLTVTAFYNTVFVKTARDLGGSFVDGVWSFDLRDATFVRDACYRCFGDDGVRKNVCSVRLTLQPGYSRICAPITFFGRVIARASGRDSGAKRGGYVVLLSGCFVSGGSYQNWTTAVAEGAAAVVILRDVSRLLVDEYVPENGVTVEILTEQHGTIETLLAQREILRKELAATEAKLRALGYRATTTGA